MMTALLNEEPFINNIPMKVQLMHPFFIPESRRMECFALRTDGKLFNVFKSLFYRCTNNDKAYFNYVAAVLLECHNGFNVLVVARFINVSALYQTFL